MHLRLALAVGLALALALAGCGSKPVSFTRANYGTLMSNAQRYDGAHVDIVGEVFLVDRELPGATWVAIYADPKNLTWETIVEIPEENASVDENQLVHVVGVVKPDLTRPASMAGFDLEPVILASKATLAKQQPG
jgi:hypothetical protein